MKNNSTSPGARRARWLLLFVVLVPSLVVASAEGGTEGGGELTHSMMTLVIQLAAILIAAKIGGALFQSFLKIPAVLGELTAGVIISPYALGPVLGLFARPEAGAFPVTHELYGIATVASILLLYLAGLETDLALFLRFSVVGTLVGLGGVIVSFVLGAWSAKAFGLADSYFSGSALFMGTISTATSVGITARILGERKQLHTPEGVTILAGAVVDDVLGIIVLAVVVGIAKVEKMGGGHVPWSEVGLVAAKAFGFWLVCTAAGLALSNYIGKALRLFKSNQDMAAASLGLALLLAGVSEKAGLAMILGAYIMGLSLSRQDSARELQHRLEPMHQTLISVFFCVMGMLVNVQAMKSVWLVGLAYTFFAIIAKIVGCAVPPLFLGFNKLGAFRVGVGMLPRGEVALIVAGIGLAEGIVEQQVFGIAIMMTLITTFVAPLVMVRIFHNKPGLRRPMSSHDEAASPTIELTLPRQEIADFLMTTAVDFFRAEECFVYQVSPGEPFYRIRQGDISIAIEQQGAKLVVTCRPDDVEFARLMMMESVASLIGVFEELNEEQRNDNLRTQLLSATA